MTKNPKNPENHVFLKNVKNDKKWHPGVQNGKNGVKIDPLPKSTLQKDCQKRPESAKKVSKSGKKRGQKSVKNHQKWSKNDQKMTKKWQKNDQKSIQKWPSRSQKYKENG